MATLSLVSSAVPATRRRIARPAWSPRDIIRMADPEADKPDPIVAVVASINENSGLSLDVIAAGSKVSITTLRSWAKGETRRPQHHTIRSVLRFHGLDLQIFQIDK